jgi:predicted HicB family RNase H-like nuclease
MARDVETILSDMRANPEGIKFNEACKVAAHFFGGVRQAKGRRQSPYLQNALAGRSAYQPPEGRPQSQAVSDRADAGGYREADGDQSGPVHRSGKGFWKEGKIEMAHHYSYRVVFSPEDGEWVGLCTEFPSLSHLAATQVEAMQGITNLVAAVVADMIESGEPLPEAMSDRSYSGKFVTRVPEQLHRTLAIEAAEAGISLNRLVSYKLAMPIPMTGRSVKGATKPQQAA